MVLWISAKKPYEAAVGTLECFNMPNLESARAWYGDSDPVHNFGHILRVYRMAGKIALAEGADLDIVRAAALLHDALGDSAAVRAPRSASCTTTPRRSSPLKSCAPKAGINSALPLSSTASAPIVSAMRPSRRRRSKPKSSSTPTNWTPSARLAWRA